METSNSVSSPGMLIGTDVFPPLGLVMEGLDRPLANIMSRLK